METSGNNEADGDARIATSERMLLIIEALANARRAMTPSEINSFIGLPKQSIHRICNVMLTSGYLERSTDPKRLQPSRRIRAMGTALLALDHVDIARHQILNWVASTVREAVNFVVPEQRGMFYLDRVETDWPFRVQLPVGTNVPFHCTASGKTYLASLPLKRRRALVQALDLSASSQNTITDHDELLREIARIADAGYALDLEEFMEGLVALAVPVTDADGRFIAALAFHGPGQRLDLESAMAHLPTLHEGARRLQALYAAE